MIKSGKVENWQTAQGLVLFIFPSRHLFFFSVCFFPINTKTLSPVFLISHLFSRITSSYFNHYDYANSELITLRFCFLEDEFQLKYIFCEKSVSKMYERLLKLCECLLLSYPNSHLSSNSF